MTTNTQIHSLEKAMAILAAEPAVLFYFTTTSCNVGEALEPKVRNLLLAKFPLVKFYTIDLNFSSEISAEFSAFVEPTILVFFEGKETIKSMVAIAELTRNGFVSGDLSTVMSPRTVITWAENTNIIEDIDLAFKLTFFNKCDEMGRPIVSEYYQRCFGRDLIETKKSNDD